LNEYWQKGRIASRLKKGRRGKKRMGRRGLAGIAEFFIGSVSQKVLHGTKDLSVILVS